MAQDKDLKEAKARIKQLEQLVEQQSRHINLSRSAKYKLPTGGGKRGRPRKSFCRVIVPDSHGCYADGPAIKAFLNDLEQIQPQEIVMLGDHLECGGFLAEHHTLNYVAQGEYTFAEDCNAANKLLDEIQKRAPGATIHYLEGNHERRIETFLITATLRNPIDAKHLRKMFSTSEVLSLDKRGINFYPQGVVQPGQSIPNIMRLGNCNFTHGVYTSMNAAKKTVDELVCNIVYGHTHRADSYIRRTADGVYGAWNPGCLCQPQMYFMHGKNTHHTHGYGLQGVQGDRFLHLNVPIVGGESLLMPLTGILGC